MTTNSITDKFKNILDHSLVLSGDDLKSRFYHIWKTDISLESVCLLTPKTTKQVSEIIKICNENNRPIIPAKTITFAADKTNIRLVINLFLLMLKNILLLSDTHGYIDEKIISHTNYVDEVWHAGDIGDTSVIDSIKLLLPITFDK